MKKYLLATAFTTLAAPGGAFAKPLIQHMNMDLPNGCEKWVVPANSLSLVQNMGTGKVWKLQANLGHGAMTELFTGDLDYKTAVNALRGHDPVRVMYYQCNDDGQEDNYARAIFTMDR